jgi:hypothetical protein
MLTGTPAPEPSNRTARGAAGETPDGTVEERRANRRIRLAAPWLAGGAAAAVTFVTTTAEWLPGPPPLRVALIAGASLLAGFDELGDRWWQARARRSLAEVLIEAGRHAEAREPAAQALEIYRSLGNAAGESRAQEVLARATAP